MDSLTKYNKTVEIANRVSDLLVTGALPGVAAEGDAVAAVLLQPQGEVVLQLDEMVHMVTMQTQFNTWERRLWSASSARWSRSPASWTGQCSTAVQYREHTWAGIAVSLLWDRVRLASSP